MTGHEPAVGLQVDRDYVAWLTFDLPGSKVNLLGVEVMAELDQRLSELESTIATGRLVAIVVRSGKSGNFIAGADVGQIAALTDPEEATAKSREGQRIFRRLERLTVPTIAAVDGTCLGGGTELILACRYRLASDRPSTKIGLPEIKLGILPGFGGTVRLPRLIGIRGALDVILTGKSLSATRAYRLGLVDRVVSHERFDEAIHEFVREVLDGSVKRAPRRRSLSERLLEDTSPGRRLLFSMAHRSAEQGAGGHYPAPLRALEVIRSTYGMPIDRALEVEAQALGELAVSDVSKALIRIFLLQQRAKRALPAELLARRREVGRAAVLGAGVMGGSIAELIASRDVPVILKDIQQSALDEGLRHARGLLEKAGRRGVLRREEVGLKFALIYGTLSYDGLHEADMVIEAVVERMAVKQQVLKECEERLDGGAVFATNTSSLSVSELASAAAHPERVVGLHFFNPVHRMPLVEVVRTEMASEEAMATAFGFALDLGKTPVLCADSPGFVVNRLLAPYLNETGYLLEEGASVEELDGALREFGMPMGPCRLLDEVGFDIAEHVAREMESAFGERMRASESIARLREGGRLGRKNGRGFYIYEKGRQRRMDRGVAEILGRPADGRGPSRDLMRRRCLYPMVNEAAYVLAEAVVESAGVVDLAMVMGTGFPPFRGGLLRWADREGLPAILEDLRKFEQAHGARFAPAPLLVEMVESDRSFTDPV
ncbi:MAG: 3-hydroxyacyl-CoA dehydrogenase NAD-binding domain-containing protein [Gemmatimonadota bacterium]